MRARRKQIDIAEVANMLKVRKVHSMAAWDDPAPMIACFVGLAFHRLAQLLKSR